MSCNNMLAHHDIKNDERLTDYNKMYKLYRSLLIKNIEGMEAVQDEPSPAVGERIGDYEISGLYKIFYDLADDVYKDNFRLLDVSQRLESLFEKFNQKLSCCENNYVFEGASNFLMVDESLFDGLFLSKEDFDICTELIKDYLKAYDNLKLGNKLNPTVHIDLDCVEEYLDAYLGLCRFVFKPNCLYQEELRSLKIIENLLNVGYNENEGCFGVYSPFVLFSVLKTLKYIAALPDNINHSDLSVACAECLNSRKHILATYAVRSFSRFTIIRGKSYVVEYSRRKDKIICKDVETVSSIDNIKPIRLLEKITSHIYNYFKEANFENDKKFIISIYGFCSYQKDGKFEPAEIEDLVYEVFSWFEDKRGNDPVLYNKNLADLQIDYYLIKTSNNKGVSYSCKYDYYEDSKNVNQKRVYSCNVNIYVCDYEDYNNKHLSKRLEKSDIVFILDCPWLATEDFSLENEGDLTSYYQWVSKASYSNDFELSEQPLFNRTHLLASINDQFNRLAIDSMAKYGKVVRVMKDYMLKWIQGQVEDYKTSGIYKAVYVYNSSLRGMSYSDYADYPIIREESYSNKRFSIMRFSTRQNHSIILNENNCIYISLWNLVKYVDISFAYIGIKEYFTKYLYEFADVPRELFESEDRLKEIKQLKIRRDIISVLRNIIFVIKYSNNDNGLFNDVLVEVLLSDPVRKGYIECNKNEIELNITNLIDFFKNIIIDVIFKNSKGLGDDCIRDAFERCLYNQSKSVNDIFFIHTYTVNRKSNMLQSFNVNVCYDLRKKDDIVDSLVPNFDAFSDKRAYQKLFNYLDMPMCPEFSINSVLNHVDKIFNNDCIERHHSQEILCNIKSVCEQNGYINSFLYRNLKEFI